MIVYQDIFSRWEDVQESYDTKYPEPEKVFFATYSYEDYSGNSEVLFYDKGKYYWVSAGHCSCYGLEGQFDPVEYETKQEFLACLEKSYHKENHELLHNVLMHDYVAIIWKTPLEI